MNISLVPQENIKDIWASVLPFIYEAVRVGQHRWSIESVAEDLFSGTTTLWVFFDDEAVIKGAATVRMMQDAKGRKILCIDNFGSATNSAKWMSEAPRVWEQYAADQGCSFIELFGIPKWTTMAELNDYQEIIRVFRKEIPEQAI